MGIKETWHDIDGNFTDYITFFYQITFFHFQIEQLAFSPSALVPGIEPSPDKMLQGRLFSYSDTHLHRLGANYLQIPVNCPYRTRIANYQRDGFMTVTDNQVSSHCLAIYTEFYNRNHSADQNIIMMNNFPVQLFWFTLFIGVHNRC